MTSGYRSIAKTARLSPLCVCNLILYFKDKQAVLFTQRRLCLVSLDFYSSSHGLTL